MEGSGAVIGAVGAAHSYRKNHEQAVPPEAKTACHRLCPRCITSVLTNRSNSR